MSPSPSLFAVVNVWKQERWSLLHSCTSRKSSLLLAIVSISPTKCQQGPGFVQNFLAGAWMRCVLVVIKLRFSEVCLATVTAVVYKTNQSGWAQQSSAPHRIDLYYNSTNNTYRVLGKSEDVFVPFSNAHTPALGFKQCHWANNQIWEARFQVPPMVQLSSVYWRYRKDSTGQGIGLSFVDAQQANAFAVAVLDGIAKLNTPVLSTPHSAPLFTDLVSTAQPFGTGSISVGSSTSNRPVAPAAIATPPPPPGGPPNLKGMAVKPGQPKAEGMATQPKLKVACIFFIYSIMQQEGQSQGQGKAGAAGDMMEELAAKLRSRTANVTQSSSDRPGMF